MNVSTLIKRSSTAIVGWVVAATAVAAPPFLFMGESPADPVSRHRAPARTEDQSLEKQELRVEDILATADQPQHTDPGQPAPRKEQQPSDSAAVRRAPKKLEDEVAKVLEREAQKARSASNNGAGGHQLHSRPHPSGF